MRTVNAYIYLTPNQGNGDFYAFSTRADYLAAIASNRLETIAMPNYRIENGEMRLSSLVNGRGAITYFVELDYDDAEYFRAYKVREIREYSGMYVYSLEVDLWATYYLQASFASIRVNRSNLNVGTGEYDEVKAVSYSQSGDAAIHPLTDASATGISYLTLSQCCIVLYANVVTAQSIDNTTLITSTHAFVASLDDVVGGFSASTQGTVNPVELAVKFASGIYKAGSSFWLDNKVEIVKAYIIPRDYLGAFSNTRTISFTTKTEFDSNADITASFSILNSTREIRQFAFDASNFDLNYKYYVGGIDGGLEMQRLTQDCIVFVITYIDNDGLRVVVRQGDREKEVTSIFEVGITGTSRTSDAGQDIARIGHALTNSIDVGMRAANARTGAYAGRVGLGVVNKVFSSYFDRGGAAAAPLLGSGDGTTTFTSSILPTAARVRYPLYFVAYRSTIDEKAHARLFGASYDVLIDDLRDLTTGNFDMLGDGASNRVFVSADVQIAGVPIAAQDYIRQSLANGVYLKVI